MWTDMEVGALLVFVLVVSHAIAYWFRTWYAPAKEKERDELLHKYRNSREFRRQSLHMMDTEQAIRILKKQIDSTLTPKVASPLPCMRCPELKGDLSRPGKCDFSDVFPPPWRLDPKVRGSRHHDVCNQVKPVHPPHHPDMASRKMHPLRRVRH